MYEFCILYKLIVYFYVLFFVFSFFLGGGGTPCFRIGVVEDNFFSVYEVPFVRTLNPKSAFLFIKCGIKYPK